MMCMCLPSLSGSNFWHFLAACKNFEAVVALAHGNSEKAREAESAKGRHSDVWVRLETVPATARRQARQKKVFPETPWSMQVSWHVAARNVLMSEKVKKH